MINIRVLDKFFEKYRDLGNYFKLCFKLASTGIIDYELKPTQF